MSQTSSPSAPRESRGQEKPLRLHHYAFVIKDQEVNRAFFEDLLEIPLVATWCERARNDALGRDIDYCHTFYELADGSALAFFQYADSEAYELLRSKTPSLGSHFAMKVTQAVYDRIVERCHAAGQALRQIDHGYCKSVYLVSPDGLRLEFTIDAPDHEEIGEAKRDRAHADLARWLAGDHAVNNDLRHLRTPAAAT